MNNINCVGNIDLEIPKPILKWVGGKTQILDKIIPKFPTNINNYHEIFLGGGSVLFTLLTYVKNKKIKIENKINAYDINEPLIYMYKNIQTNHNEIYNEIQNLLKDYNTCPVGNEKIINKKTKTKEDGLICKENYYYYIRNLYNTLSNNDKKNPSSSALFIFLNKTCFRGLFRTGPNGFNVPFGHYNNPEIINKEHLEEISNLIKDVNFKCCSYSESLNINNIKKDDFIYLDPPYAPENEKSFVGYTSNGFDLNNHNNLFNLINILTQNKIKIMMSNADVKLLEDNFEKNEKNKYKVEKILCKRSINSKKPDSKTNEVLIINYNC